MLFAVFLSTGSSVGYGTFGKLEKGKGIHGFTFLWWYGWGRNVENSSSYVDSGELFDGGCTDNK